MNINQIIDFLCDENDRLYPFIRTNKILNNLSEINEYIKINFKPNINLNELGKELKVNIIIINKNLEFNCLNNNYDKYICLIEHKNGYEFAYISQNNKIIYIYKKDEIKNVNLNILNSYQENINTITNINNSDDDNSDDYEAIKNNTIDEHIITEDLQTEDFNSIKDIIKKELGNDINTEDLNEIDDLSLTETKLEIESNKNDSKNIESTNKNKIVDGFVIPKELINMDLVKLKKMLKNDIVNYFQKVNNVAISKYTKITKDKLIEMIKN
jgi:hypothetical protein